MWRIRSRRSVAATRLRGSVLGVAVLALLLSACGPAQPTAIPSATPTPALTSRPSSPVVIRLVSPTNGEVVHGTKVHVVVAISGGTVVQTTGAAINPREGHVHVYLQNELVFMSYTLSQDLAVTPGLTYTMHAEWVGQDHFPFYPRDTTPNIVFTVAKS